MIEPVSSQQAKDLMSICGRLVIAGYHRDGSRSINQQQWNWKGIHFVNAHERDPEIYVQGMREAIAAVTEQRLKIDVLRTHRFPLSEINDAFTVSASRPDGFLKAWVQHDSSLSLAR